MDGKVVLTGAGSMPDDTITHISASADDLPLESSNHNSVDDCPYPDAPPALPAFMPKQLPGMHVKPSLPPLRYPLIEDSITHIGMYKRSESYCGRGRFGKVCFAEAPGGWRCAVKICDRAFLSQQYRSKGSVTEYDALCNEITILRSLHHPGIVHLYDVFETKAKTFMIMEALAHPLMRPVSEELLQGSFPKFVCPQTSRCLSELRARRIMRKLLGTLYYLHAQGWAHGDIKLDNIMMRAHCSSQVTVVDSASGFHEDPVLIDFGKAQSAASPGYEVGTPAFAAPECFDGSFDVRAADMWSVGVCLFVMLTGELPFSGQHSLHRESSLPAAAALMEDIRSAPLPLSFHCITEKAESSDPVGCITSQQCPSADVIDILQKLLSRDPTKRITAHEALEHAWFATVEH